ncbi:hypothetical protein LguiB_017504 [Lonicera macranthoides]
MTRKRPMIASEMQRKSKKHCAVTAAKQHGKTKKPITPTSPGFENDPPSQNEPQCEGNNDPLSTQNDPQNEENPSHSVARENPQIEGPSDSDKGAALDRPLSTFETGAAAFLFKVGVGLKARTSALQLLLCPAILHLVDFHRLVVAMLADLFFAITQDH